MFGENLVPLAEVPKLKYLPRRPGGKRHHVATIYRWAQRGIRGVRLETLKVGGSTCTSVEALERFFVRLSAAEQVRPSVPAAPTTAARRRQMDGAAREAAALVGTGGSR